MSNSARLDCLVACLSAVPNIAYLENGTVHRTKVAPENKLMTFAHKLLALEIASVPSANKSSMQREYLQAMVRCASESTLTA